MTFQELPEDIQAQLNKERELLKGKHINTPYLIHIYNAEGTRYFYARRECLSWADDKGHSMPFGGGSRWKLCYGKVQFERYKNPLGEVDYRWCDGKAFGKSTNGTFIPRSLGTKKEVVALARAIGVFNI